MTATITTTATTSQQRCDDNNDDDDHDVKLITTTTREKLQPANVQERRDETGIDAAKRKGPCGDDDDVMITTR